MNMLTKVANAIASSQKASGGTYLDDARAAMEAMGDPTEAMLRASDNVVLNEEEFHAGPYELAKAEWKAMITAALEDRA